MNATKICTDCGHPFITSRTGSTVRCADCRKARRSGGGRKRKGYTPVKCSRCGTVYSSLKCPRCGI